MSIRTRFIILFLLVALLPPFVIGAITFTNYKNSLLANHFTQLKNIAAFKADAIERYFSNLNAGMRIAQSSYIFRKDLPVLVRLSQDKNSPEFSATSYGIDRMAQGMQKALGLLDIMLVSPQGRIVYSSNPKHSHEDFLKKLPDPGSRAFSEGSKNIYLSEMFLNPADDGSPGMLLSAPEEDLNGNFAGVIVFELDLEPVYKLIQDTVGLGRTGETLIGKKMGNEIVFLNSLRHDQLAALKRKITVGSSVGEPLQKAVQGLSGEGILNDYRGRNVVAAWRYIPSLGWGVVAKIDSAEALADIERLKAISILILAIISILSGLMALLIARSIAKPLRRLVKSAEIFGSGNLGYRVELGRKDEIGQLASAFNNMAQNLKAVTASRDDLDAEIAVRKSAENALREIEKDLRRAQEVSHTGSWRLDVRSNELTWSDENHRIFGILKAGPMTYETFLSTVYPADLEYVNKKWNAALKGEPYDIEHRIIVNGKIRWVREKAHLEFDDKARLMGGFGTTQDITEAKHAEEELRKITSYLETLINYANAPIIIWDHEFRVTRFNRAFEHMTGYNSEEVIGRQLDMLFPQAAKEEAMFLIKQTLKGERWESVEMPVKRKDGAVRIALWNSANIYSEDGNTLISTIAQGQDITERKQALEILKRDKEDLEELIKNKSKELLSAQAQAEQGKRLSGIGTLAATVAHELRNPLAAIKMATFNIRRKAQNPNLDKHLSNIDIKVLESEQIITNLLYYSRLKPPHLQKVNVHNIISSCIQEASAKAPEGVAIERKMERIKSLSFQADPLQIKEVFSNLLNNALDALESNKGSIEVLAEPDDGSLKIKIRDNGMGIEKDNLESVFEPFFTTKAKGTGLGLPVCRQIVRMHNGEISIASEKGKGTVVTVQLPIVE